MDMDETLSLIAGTIGTTRAFTARSLGERRGRAVIFPVGLGSALGKAVRAGYLSVLDGGTRRRGRVYAFTTSGSKRAHDLIARIAQNRST